MELERPRPAPALEGQVDLPLPPPPAPFPTEFISSITTSRASQTDDQSQRLRTLQAQINQVQRSCIDTLTDLLSSSPSLEEPRNLSSDDSKLAVALTELLEVTYDLESSNSVPLPSDEGNLESAFQALAGNLEDLQSSSNLRQRNVLSSASTNRDGNGDGSRLHPSVYAVREELAWARLESLSNVVVGLVKERKKVQATSVPDLVQASRSTLVNDGSLPPRYSVDQRESGTEDGPPTYAAEHDHAFSDEKVKMPEESRDAAPSSSTAPREKMLLELDGLADAIGRLHSITPRLNDQRVEFRASSSKGATLPADLRARAEREKVRELELIWDQIERTHGKRRMKDGQRADPAGWEERRAKQKQHYLESLFDQSGESRFEGQDAVKGKVDAELARARDLRDRDLFLRDLIEQSADSRLSNQDADGVVHQATMTEARRQRFFASVMDKNEHGHLDGQVLPQTMDERLDEGRHEFFSSVVERSAHGRMKGQDSAPPTPRSLAGSASTVVATGQTNEEVSMQDFFRENHQRSPSTTDDGEKKGASTSGFSRIKGLIRRGSVGLGLATKANPNGNGDSSDHEEIDLADLSYIAEHQENLNLVQIMVHGPGIPSSVDLFIETDTMPSDKVTLYTKHRNSQLQLTLPVPVVPDQRATLVAPNLHLEAKLAALPISPSAPVSSLNTMITQALCAADLRRIKPRAICCTACDREIVDLPARGTFKDLPSEHWAEMLEVWMCHADPGFTADISAQTKDGFWPSAGTVLVGGSYLLLEDEYTKRDNLGKDAPFVNGWRVVHCLCGEVLGKQREHDGRPGHGTMRLSKWSIALLHHDDGGDEEVEPVRFPLSVFLVSDMLELAQAHASYRFAIADETTNRVRLVIWLFNPSVRISYLQSNILTQAQHTPTRSSGMTEKRKSWTSTKSRRSSIGSTASVHLSHLPSQTQGPSSLRASKIMYKIVEGDEGHEVLPGFGPSGQVEELSYPKEVCDRLAATLRESTALYPTARRTMGVFDVGFLERV